ncbi:MAG: radical SAM protein [Desulfomonilaceae bacterium]|jgi:radical SAM superfamily enzyme YgiQ (UPF0313 family)
MNSHGWGNNKKGPIVLVSRPIAYTFPLSYAYLAGYLLQQGEDVRIVFKRNDNADLIRQIMEMDPLLVGFGSLYPELREVAHLIDLLDKAGRRFPTVIGGQMVSPIPEFAVEISGADFGVIGEGEIILSDLVRSLREGNDSSDLPGLVIRNGKEIVSNGPGPYIQDLAQLPPVPYELFPVNEWLRVGKWYSLNYPQPHWRHQDRVINVHGGRGCPYRCNFCYHHSVPRYRPIPQMLDEAQLGLERFNANMLYFSDDLVLATPSRALQLVNGLRQLGKSVDYSVSTRFDILNRLDDNLLEAMRETGCRIMGLGIESGSDRILKLIGKNCTSTEILHNLGRLKRVGILPTVSIMVGQFTETVEDVEASIKLMIESIRDNPNIQYAFTITTPFPGSPLYEYILKNGLVKNNHDFYERYFSGDGHWNMVVNLSKMTNEEVFAMYKKINTLYLLEKKKCLGHAVNTLLLGRRIFNRVNRFVESRLLQRSETSLQSPRIANTYYSFQEKFCNSVQNLDLRLRGLQN